MSKQSDPITRAEFAEFGGNLLRHLTESAKVVANGFEVASNGFTHIHKRLDDIDRKLELIEGRSKTMEGDIIDIKADVHEVKSEGRMFQQILDMFKIEGEEMEVLRQQVKKLKDSSKEEPENG